MTSHIWMFFFFLLMGVFAFGFPLLVNTPENKETYLTLFQVGTFICTSLSGLNAFDDLKNLVNKQNISQGNQA